MQQAVIELAELVNGRLLKLGERVAHEFECMHKAELVGIETGALGSRMHQEADDEVCDEQAIQFLGSGYMVTDGDHAVL